jgi:flagellar hook-basal body complex protein FliE
MTINTQDYPVSGINSISFKPVRTQQAAQDSGSLFDSALKSATEALDETNDYQKASEKLQMDFAAGSTDDILSVMLAQQKAYDSLNFTVQVTNKLIETYQTIMQMQI